MTKVLFLSGRADAASRIAADGWEVAQVRPGEVDVAAAAAAHRVAIVDLESAPDALDVAIAMRAANGSLEFVAFAADERGAVDAVRRGAFDAIPWPTDPLEARLMIEAAVRATAPPSPVADAAGEWIFRKRLAVGGMAEVFLADSPQREGFAVVKCLLPSLAKDHEIVEMFAVEARTSALLVHPNIVRVIDWGSGGDRAYIVLEHVDGWDLDRVGVAVRWRFPPAIACHIVAEVCRGLGYAHARTGEDGEPLALVHRDVNPPNILLSKAGDVRVSDFGIAKSAYSTVQTQHGIIKGKVDWFSPEQVEGVPLDGRSDVFSAGAILHLLLTGRHPFRALTRIATMNKIREAAVTPPTQLRAGLPPQLDAIVVKALARDREQRYRRADDLESALRGVVDSLGGVTREDLARFLTESMGLAQDVRAAEATAFSAKASSEATILRPLPSRAVIPQAPADLPTVTPAERTISAEMTTQAEESTPPPRATALPLRAPPVKKPEPPAVRGRGLRIAAIALPALAALGVGASLGTRGPAATPPPVPSVRPETPKAGGSTTEIAKATPVPQPSTEIARSTPAVVATARPAPKNGTLSIWMVDGWASIRVDGKSLGLNAPRVGIPIPEGKHRITLENPALGFKRHYEVTISPGKETRLQVVLPPK